MLRPVGFALIISSLLLALAVSSKMLNFDLRSRASYKPPRILIDADSLPGSQVQSDVMSAFAQGGEEPSDMIGPVIGQVSGLHPKIIRIDHIYDAYQVVTPSGYDFSGLDSAVRSIVKTGATPMLSLSYMPAAYTTDGSLLSFPKNWNDWSALVAATIERYSGKNGFRIDNMLYEVWNEPDLAQFGGFKTYGNKNYLDLYRASIRGAEAAKEVLPFRIGGPATTALYRGWIDALIGADVRIDFLSWHVYSADPKKPAEDAKTIRSWLSATRLSNIPLIISELGFDSRKDERYSGRFAAAYTAAVFRYLLDVDTEAVLSFELKDGPNDDQVGWGMISHESKGGIRKARYYVYPFLSKFGGSRLPLAGEGTSVLGVAAREGKNIRILLTNYHESFAQTETVPITLTGIASGRYRVKTEYLLGASSTKPYQTENGTMTITILSNPYSVIEIDITPEQ